MISRRFIPPRHAEKSNKLYIAKHICLPKHNLGIHFRLDSQYFMSQHGNDAKCVKFSSLKKKGDGDKAKDTCHHIMCDFVLQSRAIKSNSFQRDERYSSQGNTHLMRTLNFELLFSLSRCRNLMLHS